ncbi:hypothetical protein [Streptomyces sp. NPDC006140]|uniref:hypothetical protein n=1 Tax=Streptomyces sp. NPDC006140 TaxID=3154579 RepID=UPI0034011FE7
MPRQHVREAGEHLADAARAAFAHGLQVNAFVAAPLMLAMALGAIYLLRQVKPNSHEEEPEHSDLATESR